MKSCWLAFAALLMCACQRAAPSPSAASSSPPLPEPVGTSGTNESGPVAVDFQNVHFRIGPGIVLEVRRLQGALVSRQQATPPVFDDVSSYVVRIDAGEVAMSAASLTALLNTHVFNYEDSPITDLEISIEEGRLKQKGTLHKGVALPFTIVADISATRDGRIRLRPVSVEAAGLPAASLMSWLHVELDDLVASNAARGFETVDNDLLLVANRLLPDPRVTGTLTRISIEGDRIVQIFGSAPAAPGRGPDRNYQHFRGHRLRFGRLTMTNTDLRLIDADPSDAFDFSPREYVRQLVAGYSKNAADGSLRVYMPDFGDAGRAGLRPAAVLH